MSLLSNLLSKVFGAAKNTATTYGDAITTIKEAILPPPAAINPVDSTSNIGVLPILPTTPEVLVAPPEPVDVTAILDGLAAAHPEKLDWKRSIVDLMKLIGMDSSLSDRKELAKELEYSGDFGDSAKMNVWLHKKVIQKISENGGIVPEDLLS